MFDLFNQTRKFKPMVLGAYDGDKLCGVLLGAFIYERKNFYKLLSSRFVIYGGPLLTGDETQQAECLDALLKILVQSTRKKALFIQFRNFFSQEHLLPVYKKYGFELINRLNYIVHTSERNKVLQNMSESRRRQIRKALNNGSSIIEPENPDQFRELYNILFKLYRYKIRKPLPDWSFFENFYQESKQGRLGIIRLIKYENRIIGGIIAPVFKDKFVYEWYVCGLDKEYKDQHPSVLATWAGIDYAIENNIPAFDFMGVGKPDKHYGVREFKARFGGELVNHGRLTRINNQFLYGIAEFGFNVLALLKKI
ncbi:MAG: GNAT family N-acetyltransferase [Bacteroidota bacterium]